MSSDSIAKHLSFC